MGIEVIIHGFIDCPFDFGRHDESRRVFEHNRGIIRSLPKEPNNDDEYRFIVSSMFNVHPPKGVVPFYGTNLITFGGIYKNMYRFESDWISRFEQILGRLCWHEASAFNEFGTLRCNWKAEQAYERAFADPPLPPLKWSMTTFQLSSQQIPFQEAVDEIHSSLIWGRPSESE